MMRRLPFILCYLLCSSGFGQETVPPKRLHSKAASFVSPHRVTLKDWGEIPGIIESSEEDDVFGSFSALHETAYVTTNRVTPSCNTDWTDAEKQEYSDWAKAQWHSWWKTTGSMIEDKRKNEAVADPLSWKTANELTRNNVELEPVPKIWIPQEWTMVLTLKTGDYMGHEKERWFISCTEKESVVYRIKANVWNLRPILLEKCVNITRADLQEFLAVVTYIFEYELRNPKVEQPIPEEGQPKDFGTYYYPSGTVRLDSGSHSIWNLEGYYHYLFPFQYHSQNLNSGEPRPIGQYFKSSHKAGLTRSIAKTLFDKSKDWQQVIQLGESGRRVIRDSFKDSYFPNIEADTYRFVPLAAFGGAEEALLIRQAIAQAEKIESGEASYRDFVSRRDWTSKRNKWVLVNGKEMWQTLVNHLENRPEDWVPPVEDVLSKQVAVNPKELEYLEFRDNNKTVSSAFKIAIGLKIE